MGDERMSHDRADDQDREQRLVDSLEDDPYFRDWTDASRLLGRREIQDAILLVLGTGLSALPPLPGARERAMVQLAIFQVVAHHLADGPLTWKDLLSRLSPQEMSEVEGLLGDMTLNEFLD
jgi:hypothetical protein